MSTWRSVRSVSSFASPCVKLHGNMGATSIGGTPQSMCLMQQEGAVRGCQSSAALCQSRSSVCVCARWARFVDRQRPAAHLMLPLSARLSVASCDSCCRCFTAESVSQGTCDNTLNCHSFLSCSKLHSDAGCSRDHPTVMSAISRALSDDNDAWCADGLLVIYIGYE